MVAFYVYSNIGKLRPTLASSTTTNKERLNLLFQLNFFHNVKREKYHLIKVHANKKYLCHFGQKGIHSQKRPCSEVVLRLVGLD